MSLNRLYMDCMRPMRRTNAIARTALAAVFAFMSLAHGPVMASAQGRTAPAHHEMVVGGHAHGDEPTAPSTPQKATICNSFGCFVAVAPAMLSAPAASFSLLGKLTPALARLILPVLPDRIDPPPRPHA